MSSPVVSRRSMEPESQVTVPGFSSAQESPIGTTGKPSFINKVFKQQCYLKNTFFTMAILAVLILISCWTVLYIIAGDEALPGGSLFILVVLVITAYIAGQLVGLIKLPPLLGMLITGVVFTSVGIFNLSTPYKQVIPISRDVALNVILIKAGFGLDPVALRKLKWVVIKLAFVPCLAEALSVGLVSHYIADLSWTWGFLLGFLLSPVSPAVVVPTLLSLKERGYGEGKGISTLVIAASSFDDILSISVFGVFLSLVFSSGGSLVMDIIKGPLELVAGMAGGIVWGLILGFLPHRNYEHVVSSRVALLGLGGLIAILGSKQINFEGAGPLATVTAAFVCKLIWKLQSPPILNTKVAEAFSAFWLVMQPILFSLIGTEIDVKSLQASTIGTGLAIIAVGLAFRMCVCFLMLLGGKLNWKEIIFVNLAWIPKATVQAALSAQPIDAVRNEHPEKDGDCTKANFLLTTAVLAILITAPIGSIAISLAGPKFLTKSEPMRKVTS